MHVMSSTLNNSLYEYTSKIIHTRESYIYQVKFNSPIIFVAKFRKIHLKNIKIFPKNTHSLLIFCDYFITKCIKLKLDRVYYIL